MPTTLTPWWSTRWQDLPAWRVRQIALTDRIALFAAAGTLPYQLYYLVTDAWYYLPVLLTNLAFIGVCWLALTLNRRGRFDLALDVVVGAVYVQLFVVTAYLSTGPGIHLFYFSVGASLGMMFVTGRETAAFVLMGLATALFVVCHFAFPPGRTLLSLPEAVQQAMYAVNATAAVLLAGGFAFLFRLDIDRAERDLRRSNEQLERLSGLDALTGVANRRSLDAYLTREWSRLARDANHVAVLLCDVDYFKQFNDHYGHLAGDHCLQRVAGALASTVQRSTDLLARYGGEEFLIALMATDPEHAVTVADRARTAVMELRMPHERSIVAPVVTVSVGIVVTTTHDLSEPHVLLQQADRALYAAKRDGRNRVVCTTSTGRASRQAVGA